MSVPFAPANGLQDAFSYRNIYERYLECRRNKRNTFNALKFEFNAEENILKLSITLKDHSYRPSRSLLFAAVKPKLREIFAADFYDRVVHHILVKELEKIWEPTFIHDSYACREEKGTHIAVVWLQKFLRQISKNGNIRSYYLQLDIRDFFPSIDKQILFSILKNKIKDPDILWLTELVVFWDCTQSYLLRGNRRLLLDIPINKSLFGKYNHRGLPIGNLTSQFFANVYLNELDQFVKHNLKVKHYIRYVDDFVILAMDKNELENIKVKVDKFLSERLNLNLHPKRHKLLPRSNGIDFLGYVIRPKYILVRRRVVNNLKSKLKQFKDRNSKQFNNMVASYLGHLNWANSYSLAKEMGSTG